MNKQLERLRQVRPWLRWNASGLTISTGLGWLTLHDRDTLIARIRGHNALSRFRATLADMLHLPQNGREMRFSDVLTGMLHDLGSNRAISLSYGNQDTSFLYTKEMYSDLADVLRWLNLQLGMGLEGGRVTRASLVMHSSAWRLQVNHHRGTTELFTLNPALLAQQLLAAASGAVPPPAADPHDTRLEMRDGCGWLLYRDRQLEITTTDMVLLATVLLEAT